jgi:ribosomal protein S18 acetylase RimI-like enzyme
MEIRSATVDDLDRLATLGEGLQRRPDRHIAYLGLDAATIAYEVRAAGEDWTASSAVAWSGSGGGPGEGAGPVGWLVGEVDTELGRVWWYGPFVTDGRDWARVATALHDHASARLPEAVAQEELAIDSAFEELARWAPDRGFVPDPASVSLVLPLDRPAPPGSGGPGPGDEVRLRPAVAADLRVLGPLHDELFPDTHTRGHRLLDDADDHHRRLVAELDGRPVGYVALERSPDTDGDEVYIDFVGVDPRVRRRGLGRRLIEEAVVIGRSWDCRQAALTVREDNTGARALYRSLGFSEERILRPFRKGFRIG